MPNCLLCDHPLQNKHKFTDILFFQRPPTKICQTCSAAFLEIAEQHCTFCQKTTSLTTCTDCSDWHLQGREVHHKAIYQYNQAMADYFSKYKFQGDYVLRKVFASKLQQALRQYPDYTIVPIPLGPKRLEERGFNQVEGLLEAAGIPYQNLLGKKEHQKQSAKSRTERLSTEQVFYLLEEKNIPDKLLLVDDIYTTGATLQLARDVFMKINKKEIKTFSLAR